MTKAQTKRDALQLGAYAPSDEAALSQYVTLHRHFEQDNPSDWLAEHGAKIQIIASRGDLAVPKSLLDQLPNLELIAVYGVGFDGVDLEACRARNIRVTNTPDVLTDDVADVAVGMMLAHYRGLIGAEAWVRTGQWSNEGPYPLTRSLKSLRAGVLGLGRIGKAIALRAEVFGQSIAYSATAPKKDVPATWTYASSVMALAEQSDVLYVALAATPDTRHIVNADVLQALGSHGMVVNISRAQNIDEAALLDALESGSLGGAGLDVFEGEPKVDPRFLSLSNVVLQPHLGSATAETRAGMGQLVLDNIVAHLNNEALLTPVV